MHPSLTQVNERIADRSAKVVVVGLGYVGLPVACLFAKVGYSVVGLRRDADKVALVNRGVSPIEGDEPGLPELLAEVVGVARLRASTDFAECRDAQVVLVAVETPVDKVTKMPGYAVLRGALSSLGDNLRPGTLVVIESTISPGTMAKVVQPLLEERSGLRAGRDFWLANCPERVMPGKLLHNLLYCSRVIGGLNEDSAGLALTLYRQVVQAELDVTDCVTAEIVKTAENAYRDVQIAFANEVALVCESVGADVWEVRELVNKSPGRQMHLPGAGVGGHCIPKDPWLFVAGAGNGFVPKLIPTSRAINDSMPNHIADLTEGMLRRAGRLLSTSRIAVLGFAYLENSDDTRNSPSEVLVEVLRARGAEVAVHDPYVREYDVALEDVVGGADCLVVMVAHQQYKSLDLKPIAELMRSRLVVDGRRVLIGAAAGAAGLDYCCVGDGKAAGVPIQTQTHSC